jgi:hypothetical protein
MPRKSARGTDIREVLINHVIGKWKAEVEIPQDTSLEKSEERLEEGENKVMFMKFMRSMLQWRPEDRRRRWNCSRIRGFTERNRRVYIAFVLAQEWRGMGMLALLKGVSG